MDRALQEEQFGTGLELQPHASAALMSLVLFDLIIHQHPPQSGMSM